MEWNDIKVKWPKENTEILGYYNPIRSDWAFMYSVVYFVHDSEDNSKKFIIENMDKGMRFDVIVPKPDYWTYINPPKE